MWPFSSKKKKDEEEEFDFSFLRSSGVDHFEEAMKIVNIALSNCRELRGVEMLLIGDDEYGCSVQCRFKPKNTLGKDDTCSYIEWKKRATSKIKRISWFEIKITINDKDGDYRSFEYEAHGNKDAMQCMDGFEKMANSRIMQDEYLALGM